MTHTLHQGTGHRTQDVREFLPLLDPESCVLNRSGFTFVELLIAATMMSVLFLGLGAHLRGGLTVWRQATVRGEALQRQRAAFDRLERDLANAFVYDSRGEAYGTEAGKLPTPSFGKDALGYFTVERMSGGLPAVRFVTYRCEERNGTPGLWRTSQSLGEARAKLEPAAKLLLEGCTALSFRYARPRLDDPATLEWAPLTAGALLTLPRLIQVSLERSSGGRLQRVCAVPAGALPGAAAQ
jgi:type II secretory pathway pseudopilin PulG